MRTRLFAIFLLVVALIVPGYGQTFGDISGAVRDSSGASIPGAQVTIVNVDTNATRTAISNDAGFYSFPALPPGTYSVKTEKTGFKTVTRPDILIQVQQSARVDVELPVGQVTESVEVSATAAMLTTENATVGTVIENKRIVDLPLNGRNALSLVALSPNVSFGFPSAGQAGSRQGGIRADRSISIAGQRSQFNHFTLDGVENTDPNFNTYVVEPSVDALQEFKVQTGIYPAEFGRGTSQVNMSTKSGSNEFHGTAYEFLRNDKLDAKNYAFTTARPPKDPFKLNQFGFTIGGPVLIPKVFNGKNRVFFMTNYEWFRQRRNVQGLFTVPSAAARTGDFSSLPFGTQGIYDPATRANPGAVRRVPFPGQHHSREPHFRAIEEVPRVSAGAESAWPDAELSGRPRPADQSRPVHRAIRLGGVLKLAMVRPVQLWRRKLARGSPEAERRKGGHKFQAVHGHQHARAYAAHWLTKRGSASASSTTRRVLNLRLLATLWPKWGFPG